MQRAYGSGVVLRLWCLIFLLCLLVPLAGCNLGEDGHNEGDGGLDGDASDGEVGAPCSTDDQCDDGQYCNGLESCAAGHCHAGDPPDCDDDDDCTDDRCSESANECRNTLRDDDRDGEGAEACGGDDCDDSDPEVFPRALERCNGQDDNCNVRVDESIAVEVLDTQFASPPALADTGDGLAMAWSEQPQSSEPNPLTRFMLMSEAGAPEREPVVLGPGTGDPALTCVEDECVVAWTNTCDGPECPRWLNVTRFSLAGEQQGETVQIGSGRSGSLDPRIVSTGSGYGLAWIDRVSDTRRLRFLMLDREGAAVGESIVVATGELFPRHPALLWSGDSFFLAYTDEFEGSIGVHLAQISDEAELVQPPRIVTSGSGTSQHPALVWMDSELAISWENDGPQSGHFEIFFAGLEPDGTMRGEPSQLSDSTGTSGAPVLLWTGTEVAISWLDRLEDRESIYFARLSNEGVISEGPIWLDSASGYATDPDMVMTDAGFVIAWGSDSLDMFEARGLYLSRICAF